VFVVLPFSGRDIPDAGGLPLGALYLAASLPTGWDAYLVDAYSPPFTIAETIGKIMEMHPDVLAISIPFSPQMAYMRDLSCGLRASLHDVFIIAGGPHVSFLAEKTLEEYPELNCVVRGEGEITLARLLEHFPFPKKGIGRSVAGIPGLAYRVQDKIFQTDDAGLVGDIDTLPFPDLTLIANRDEYTPRVITSRGCVYDCTFCSSRNFWGARWRSHSPDRVVDEIERIIDLFGNKPVSIGDDNFAVNRNRVLEICEGIHARNLKINFGISAHPDDLDVELIRILGAAGMDSIFLGIESGERKIREAIGKDFDEDNLMSTLVACRDSDVSIHASFMLGIPGENESDMQATLTYADNLPVDSLGFHMFNPLPGSRMAEEPERYGFEIISGEYADMAIDTHYRIRTPSLHSLAVLDYYYRGRGISNARKRERCAEE